MAHVEDTPHASRDRGEQMLAVRNDTAAALADTDGDYAPLQVDALGNLYTALPAVATATTGAGNIAVTNTSISVLAAKSDRRAATFVNDSDEVIYLALTATAVASKGIRLNAAGGSYQIDATNLYTGAVAAICATNTKNLVVTEF